MSKLTREIKQLLEDRFPFVWISGEISNYAVPASGHSYFSLKDANAVINCAMFKGQKRQLKFRPENGMKIMGMARLSLYEPRGNYQLIFEHMEPEGAGSLQVAFEQLKAKLTAQGLFDQERKKQLPGFPRKINIITSGTGAAVRDILNIAGRRAPYCSLEILPVKVQGDGADLEIVQAIETANAHNRSDLIILARGGGSLEDLSAFNTEGVALAIAASKIPIVTGIGHETDFTIADFVADLRAPTPSGAAEMALPDVTVLRRRVLEICRNARRNMNQRMDFCQQKLDDLHGRLKRPDQVIAMQRSRVTELSRRMERAIYHQASRKRERLNWNKLSLTANAPGFDKTIILQNLQQMSLSMEHRLETLKNRIKNAGTHLETLNPESVLNRGYGMVRTLPGRDLVHSTDQLDIDDRVEIILSKGRLQSRVEKIDNA